MRGMAISPLFLILAVAAFVAALLNSKPEVKWRRKFWAWSGVAMLIGAVGFIPVVQALS